MMDMVAITMLNMICIAFAAADGGGKGRLEQELRAEDAQWMAVEDGSCGIGHTHIRRGQRFAKED